MSDKVIGRISYKDLSATPGTRYRDVELAAGVLTVASACSADVLQWFKDNEDPLKKGFAGLRMAVICLGVPVEERDDMLQTLLARDWQENDKIAHAALVVTGLRQEKEPVKGAMGVAADEQPESEAESVKND